MIEKINPVITLADAWVLFKRERQKGWDMIQQSERDLKAVASMPVNTRVSVWYAGSEMCVEGVILRCEGYKVRLAADKAWLDAVLREKGDIKLTWLVDGDEIECTLDTGEVFR